jgi:hypothetical protein
MAAAAAGTTVPSLRGTVPSGDSPDARRAYDAKGLPTAILGKTGVAVPRIGIGLGSRYCAVASEDKALEILQAALDNGFYYWDTAYNYTNKSIVSEERLGRVLESRRKEVFLATKFEERTYDGVMRQLEGSLKRLRTDHLIIGLVDGADRVKINAEPAGASVFRLTDREWHAFKVVCDAETGEIRAYLDDMTEPILTARDRTLGRGLVGVGSFDDTGAFDDLKLRGAGK